MKSSRRIVDTDRYAAVPTLVLLSRGAAIRNEDRRWAMVVALHKRGTKEVLDSAILALNSKKLREREMGADVLGQLDFKRRRFNEQCLRALMKRLKVEKSPKILSHIGVSLGHLGDVRCVKALAPYVRHRDADVRFGVVMGVSSVQSPFAVRLLAGLSRDRVAKIRNWATFSLGTLQAADTPALRSALRARLGDRHRDTRMEAVCGLAIRKDPVGLDLVRRWLKTAKPAPRCIVDVANELGMGGQ